MIFHYLRDIELYVEQINNGIIEILAVYTQLRKDVSELINAA